MDRNVEQRREKKNVFIKELKILLFYFVFHVITKYEFSKITYILPFAYYDNGNSSHVIGLVFVFYFFTSWIQTCITYA